jgi:hypothetical protein
MNILEFSAALTRKIERAPSGLNLFSEAEFERAHVVGPARELSRQHPDIRALRKIGVQLICLTGSGGVNDEAGER